MHVTSLHLQNFTVFDDLKMNFCPGVNVLIGANSTGKTHVLKAIYSGALAANPLPYSRIGKQENGERTDQHRHSDVSPFNAFVPGEVFCPEEGDLRSLISKRSPADTAAFLEIQVGGKPLKLAIPWNSGRTADLKKNGVPPGEVTSVFIPAREVLSISPGFISAYEKRELPFDRTYRDLLIALNAVPLRELGEIERSVVEKIEAGIGGRIVVRGDHFYLKTEQGEWEANLLAEGYRRLGTISHLVRNGEIGKGTVLLWDEPECNLNPHLVSLTAQVLRMLAAAGVQVIVASHDYLLTEELDMAAEYKSEPSVPSKFFLFSRGDKSAPVAVEWGDSLRELPENPILDEFAAHYDREQKHFLESNVEGGEV